MITKAKKQKAKSEKAKKQKGGKRKSEKPKKKGRLESRDATQETRKYNNGWPKDTNCKKINNECRRHQLKAQKTQKGKFELQGRQSSKKKQLLAGRH